MQNAAFGAFTGASGLTMSQNANPARTTASNTQSDSRGTSTLADRIMSPNSLGFGGRPVF